jgi:hypothetical protein
LFSQRACKKLAALHCSDRMVGWHAATLFLYIYFPLFEQPYNIYVQYSTSCFPHGFRSVEGLSNLSFFSAKYIDKSIRQGREPKTQYSIISDVVVVYLAISFIAFSKRARSVSVVCLVWTRSDHQPLNVFPGTVLVPNMTEKVTVSAKIAKMVCNM